MQKKILTTSIILSILLSGCGAGHNQRNLAAVKQDREAIKNINNPSEEVQLAAMQNNGHALRYITNPSEQVQLAAVQNTGYAIQYIKNPSEQVQLTAVQKNGYAIDYIKNPSEQLQLAAVKNNGHVLRYITNPSEQVQLAAVKRDSGAIQYIKSPTLKVKLLLAAKGPFVVSLDKPNSTVGNNEIIVETSNKTIKISNLTKQFVTVVSISEYLGDDIMTIQNIALPPDSVKIINGFDIHSVKQMVHSENDQFIYGFAVEYQIGNEQKKNFYKTQKYPIH